MDSADDGATLSREVLEQLDAVVDGYYVQTSENISYIRVNKTRRHH